MTGGDDRNEADRVGAESDDHDAAEAVDTLRELEKHLVDRAGDDALPGGWRPLTEGQEASSLLSSLAVDAVIDTNETLGQRSLRDFLR